MLSTTQLPAKQDLNEFIDTVAYFPVSTVGLVDLAIAEGASRQVVGFFNSFPHDQVFSDYDDLAARSEQILIMEEERPQMPPEQILGPQE